MTAAVMIVGAGQAGFQAAASLREKGFAGSITLVGEESHPPYQRPPLSKGYLAYDAPPPVEIRPPSFYTDKAIDLVTGKRVASIDRPRREVRLSTGETLPYDHLVLATGGRNRRLDMAGETLDGVMTLRDLSDAERLRGRLREARHLVIVGGGYIGLEVGSLALKLGIDTSIVEAAPRLCARVASKELSQFFAEHYAQAGAHIFFNTTLAEIAGREGRVTSVRLSDGRSIAADLVLVCIGIVPNAELAEACGLETANGIIVDATLRTSDPNIHAIGDSARFPSPYAGGDLVRVESVANASDQGRAVAEAILGQPKPFRSLPWFWSEQGDLKLQIAGWTHGHDRAVTKGDPRSGSFSVFCFRGTMLAGVECMNHPMHFVAARRAMTEALPITPEEVADPAFDFKARLAAASPKARI